MATNKKNVSAPYYSIGQLRLDHWNLLKSESTDLSQSKKGSELEKKAKQNVDDLLTTLKIVEQYFAFPGKHVIEKLISCFIRDEYASLSNRVSRITHELVSDSKFSTTRLPSELDVDVLSLEETSENPIDYKKNHFEVLFLQYLTPNEENFLLNRLRELHDPNEQFTYDVTVQHSFQDALIALLFNHNIQSVVIRYAPTYKSTNISPVIKPYLQNIFSIDFENTPEADLGPILGRIIKQFRPELDTYYVTDTALSNLKDSTLEVFRRIYYGREDLQELHLAIIRGVRERYKTPFFSALMEYSQKPTGSFSCHAHFQREFGFQISLD